MIYYNDLPLDNEILKALGELNIDYAEYFTLSEQRAFAEYYGKMDGLGIIEILEYPYISKEAVEAKREATARQSLWIAIDDFGVGINNMDVVEMYDTKIVKLDRHVISGIDHEPEKQENVKKLVKEFHSRKMMMASRSDEKISSAALTPSIPFMKTSIKMAE